MEKYPFATLDRGDLEDVRSLEQILTGKLGRRIILIAYEQSGQDGSQALSALADGDDPDEYGVEQQLRETGFEPTDLQ